MGHFMQRMFGILAICATVLMIGVPAAANGPGPFGQALRQELVILGILEADGTNAAAIGPSSSVDSYVSVFSGTTGKLLDDRPVKVASTGQVSWPTGLGAITHILGPTDQALSVSGGTGQVLSLGAAGSTQWQVTASRLGPSSDNVEDLGASGVRVKDGYFGGSVSASSFNTTDGTNAQASLLNSGGGRVKVGSGGSMQWSSTTAAGGLSDTAIVRPEAKAVQPTDASTGAGYFYLGEVASAPTGTANVAKLYAVDNGAGKTQLVVIFGSGAAQVIATEP